VKFCVSNSDQYLLKQGKKLRFVGPEERAAGWSHWRCAPNQELRGIRCCSKATNGRLAMRLSDRIHPGVVVFDTPPSDDLEARSKNHPACPDHMSQEQLAALRGRLEAQQEKLLHEISRLRNEAVDAEDNWERVQRLGGIDRKLMMLNEVKAALARMDNHTYGYDERTEEPISVERLMEIPWAREN
jgi:RNA polymerase-binding transcription factor DksA